MADPIFSTSTIFNLVNRNRSEQKLNALSYSDTLSKFAQQRAEDMVKRDYFSHTDPDNKSFRDFINSTGYYYSYTGENLARRFTDIESMNQAWLKSPTHKDNILSKNYTEMGIGIKDGLIVTLFARPQSPITTVIKPQRVILPKPLEGKAKPTSKSPFSVVSSQQNNMSPKPFVNNLTIPDINYRQSTSPFSNK